MTTAAASSEILDPHHPAADGHGHDGHDHKFLAHHFDSYQHQFDAAKLGIWLFLITEVLFFSGLFCLYTIYRVNHPEIFKVGHLFLDKQLGALNTIVLLFSSLTMAWAVRCAQLGQRKGLILCLSLTLACAGAFLVVKYFEYTAKFSHGIYPARYFKTEEAAHYLAQHEHAHEKKSQEALSHGAVASPHGEAEVHGAVEHADGSKTPASHNDSHTPVETPHRDTEAKSDSVAPPKADDHAAAAHDPTLPKRIGIFFSIYFCLTGLHGIHILGGMAAISWVLWRAIRGDFTPQYYGPVDFVGLYWHLVDLIWIYLFPLLYLIQ